MSQTVLPSPERATGSPRILPNQPVSLMILAMTMWFVTEVIAAPTLNRMPVMQLVWIRYFFHLILTVLLLVPQRRLDLLRTGRPWLQSFRSLLMLVMPGSYALARYASDGPVMAVFWVAPLLLLALAPLAGDRPSRLSWGITVSAWLGVLLMFRPGLSAFGWSGFAAVMMAASFSLYIVLTRVLDRTEPLMTNLFYTAVAVFVPLSLALPYFWVPMSVGDIAIGALVATTGWITLYLFERAVRADLVSRLAPFLFVQAMIEIGIRVFDRGALPPGRVMLGVVVTAAALGIAFQRFGRDDRPGAVRLG